MSVQRGFPLVFLGVILYLTLPRPKHQQESGYQSHAVVSDNILCSNIASRLLERQGSAVDAAIAAGICVGVVNPYNSGIGGGGFMVRVKGTDHDMLDFREIAPMDSDKNMYNNRTGDSLNGALAVAIPGEIKGFQKAYQKWGKLPWKDLIMPSVELCREGFVVTKTLEKKILSIKEFVSFDKGLQELLAPNGTLLKQGDVMKRPLLGHTLQLIAEKGPDEFYFGSLMKDSVAFLQELGGIVTEEDFEMYQVVERKPLIGWFHGQKVITAPPPASGALLLSALNILEGYSPFAVTSPTGIHRIVETLKYVFSQRSYYGDPMDFQNVTQIVEQLTSKDYAVRIRRNISDARTFPSSHYGAVFDMPKTPGTTHISVLGADGEAVALTLTINTEFGAKIVSPGTGIVFNNEMDDFSIPNQNNQGSQRNLPPSPYNYIKPGKRPYSSMTPTVIQYDHDLMVIGGAGGSLIPTSVIQIFLSIDRLGMDPQAAVEAPRYHHQLYPNTLFVEHPFSFTLQKELEAKGHEILRFSEGETYCQVNVIYKKNGILHTGADPRREAGASGR